MGNIIVETVSDTSRFESLKDTWNSLLLKSRDKSIYLTWEWLFTWWKHYGSGKELNILLVRDEDRITAIAPFMLSRYRIGIIEYRVLENMCSVSSETSGVIVNDREEESLAALTAHLTGLVESYGIVLRMSQVPESSAFASYLRKHPPTDHVIADERVIASCPYLRLPPSWDEYLKSLSKKRRGNLRRALQSLQSDHTVEFVKCESGQPIGEHMRRLFDLHQRRWGELKMTSRFSRQEEREFCIEVSQLLSRNAWLDLSFMMVDGQTVSAVWGFTFEGSYYYMTPAFDTAYSSYSVGNLHILHLIERAAKNGVKHFDFLRGDEIYKHYWTQESVSNLQITLMKRGFASGVRSAVFRMVLRLNDVSKRSLKHNYYLYLDRRRLEKANNAFKAKMASSRREEDRRETT